MDEITITRIGDDGSIAIPEEYFQAMGLKIGDEVILRMEDGILYLFSPRQAIKYVQEVLRPYLPQECSLSEELIVERRLED